MNRGAIAGWVLVACGLAMAAAGMPLLGTLFYGLAALVGAIVASRGASHGVAVCVVAVMAGLVSCALVMP